MTLSLLVLLQVLFSLGKLAQIAQVSKETIESEPVQRAIEGDFSLSLSSPCARTGSYRVAEVADACLSLCVSGIDDHLDLVNSQQGLGVLFESLLSQAEGALSREERGQLVASRSSPHLSDRPTFAKVTPLPFSRLVQC